jgi:hypothetical protein
MPDLFENLIITQPPIGVTHIDFSEQVLQRFIIRSMSSQTLMEQTIQTKTAYDTRCRSTFWARDRFLLGLRPNRSAGEVHGNLEKVKTDAMYSASFPAPPP